MITRNRRAVRIPGTRDNRSESGLATARTRRPTRVCAGALLQILISSSSLSLTPTTVSAQELADDRTERLEVLADLWSRAYIYHPRVASGEVDYNGVLLNAISLVEKAADEETLVQILNEHVMGPLSDPLTSVQLATRERCGAPAPAAVQDLEVRRLSPSTAMIRVPDPRIQEDRIRPFAERVRSALEGVGSYGRVVVDLRYEVDAEVADWSSYWLGLFTDLPIPVAHYASRLHEGLNEFNSPNNYYRQRWQVDGGDVLPPVVWNGVALKPILAPVVFVVNRASYGPLSRALEALQRTGRAMVVWEESGCVVGADVRKYRRGIRAYVNPRVLLGQGQHGRPDRTSPTRLTPSQLAAIAEASPGAAALHQLDNEPVLVPRLRLLPYVAPAQVLGDRTHRLFWLMKVWMAVGNYDPHLELASRDWTQALREWIPRVEAAPDAETFFDVVRQMTSSLNDSHVRVVAPAGHPSRSVFYAPVRIEYVEGRPVVTAVDGDAVGTLTAGEEVVSVDGRSVSEVEEYMRARVSASTPGAFQREFYREAAGRRDTVLTLGVRRGGKAEVVHVRRTLARPLPAKRPANGLLPEGMGYIDISSLRSPAELHDVFARIRTSPAILLDLRGYPNFSMRKYLAQRLYDRPVKSQTNDIPLLGAREPSSFVSMSEVHLPIEDEHYSGPVVALINSVTQSAPESHALDLSHGRRVTFVGSRTAGTTGGTTVFALPGGWSLEFTGARVRYPDGRRFQNIGILPDVEVAPSIAGVSRGTDEVLARAIEVARAGLQQPR